MVLAAAPKTWPKTVFEAKLLIYFMFLTKPEDYGVRLPRVSTSTAHPNADPWSRKFWRAADSEMISARAVGQAGTTLARENACRNLILNQRVAADVWVHGSGRMALLLSQSERASMPVSIWAPPV